MAPSGFIFRKCIPVTPTALEMADVAYDVLLEVGIRVSPLPVWLDEWMHPDTHCNLALLRNIAGHSYPVGERCTGN